MTRTTDPTPTDRAPRRAAHPAGACGAACHGPTRRSVLRGAGAAASVGAAALVLAACSGPSDDDPGSTSADARPGVLAKLADVPVGGALAVMGPDDVPLVLLQPTEGTVVALVALCTHQGCAVVPQGDELVCPCHGSVFSVPDGAATTGPAEEPLAAFPVEVVDGEVVAA